MKLVHKKSNVSRQSQQYREMGREASAPKQVSIFVCLLATVFSLNTRERLFCVFKKMELIASGFGSEYLCAHAQVPYWGIQALFIIFTHKKDKSMQNSRKSVFPNSAKRKHFLNKIITAF